MDGFDDLLAPSRSVLEENPFEDPFGKRSNSPDPWATPFLNSVHGGAHEDPYAGFGTSSAGEPAAATGSSAYDEHDEGHGTVEKEAKEDGPTSPVVRDAHEPPLAVEPATSADPLESSRTKDKDAADAEDASLLPPSGSTQPRSPGFRESVPQFSETATIRPPQEDAFPSSSFSRSPPASTTIVTSPTPDLHGDGADANNAVSPIPPTPTSPRTESMIGSHAQPSPVVSNTQSAGADWGTPFSQSSKPGLAFEQSFAGLGLGAESSGWQENATSPTATTTITTTKPSTSEDDSDDDTPIGQTFGKLVAQAESQQKRQVCIVLPLQ